MLHGGKSQQKEHEHLEIHEKTPKLRFRYFGPPKTLPIKHLLKEGFFWMSTAITLNTPQPTAAAQPTSKTNHAVVWRGQVPGSLCWLVVIPQKNWVVGCMLSPIYSIHNQGPQLVTAHIRPSNKMLHHFASLM